MCLLLSICSSSQKSLFLEIEIKKFSCVITLSFNLLFCIFLKKLCSYFAYREKSFSSFSWGSSSYNIKIIGNQQIQLPIHNDKPNYELIETFITAIQKLVIKEVVLYADRKIEATKLATLN